MTSLEELTPGASVHGLVAGAVAKVVQVEWFGDQAVKVTFEEPSGAVRNRLVYRSDEDSLELVGPERAWSFGGDGYLFPAGVGGPAHPTCLSEGSRTGNPFDESGLWIAYLDMLSRNADLPAKLWPRASGIL